MKRGWRESVCYANTTKASQTTDVNRCSDGARPLGPLSPHGPLSPQPAPHSVEDSHSSHRVVAEIGCPFRSVTVIIGTFSASGGGAGMRLSREAWASGRGKLFVVSLVAKDRSTDSTELRSAHLRLHPVSREAITCFLCKAWKNRAIARGPVARRSPIKFGRSEG